MLWCLLNRFVVPSRCIVDSSGNVVEMLFVGLVT